jgi:uncharacterized protein involved in type VI secretion and phage assembly
VFDVLEQVAAAVERTRLYGAYPATVTDIRDPDSQGRVKVRLPWMPDNEGGGYDVWARLATLMAGGARGTWLVPDVGDEVLVVFEAGDARRPYVVGSLWNGGDAPPEQMDGAGNNYKKTVASRRDIRITLDDTEGAETLTLKTPGGQTIEMKDGGLSIEVKDASGNSVKLEPSGVTVTAAAQVKVQCATMEVNAGMVTVNAGMSKFSGVVQCDTLISNAVISASYTPGAGNIW